MKNLILVMLVFFSQTGRADEIIQESNPSVVADDIATFFVVLPYGTTAMTHTFRQPLDIDPFRITFEINAGCPVPPRTNVYTFSPRTQRWELNAAKGDGVYSYADKGVVTGMHFVFDQYAYKQMSCRLYVKKAKAAPAPIPSGTLLGAVSYKGGYSELMFTLKNPTIVKQITIATPDFCKDVTALEVQTVSEGVYDNAKAMGGNRFEVANGGLRIRQILVKLNGPAASQCDIPLYAF